MTAKLPDPIDVHVGRRIRMWRVKRKMSRLALGQALGLTFQQIQKYEMGTNRIGASRLLQICTVLEIPVPLLFEGARGSPPGDSGMPQDIIDLMDSPEVARFVAAYSIAGPNLRRSIARLVKKIADGAQPKASAEEPAGNA